MIDDMETLVSAIQAERERHENLAPRWRVFNIVCKCGHIGQKVSVRGEFERHVDEAIAVVTMHVVGEQVWNEAAEAIADWMWNNPSPSGIPHDPPRNPYEVTP
jgi:hypothetical protein